MVVMFWVCVQNKFSHFRMSFDDYCQNFVHTAVCRVVNTSIFTINKTWHEGSSHGAWKKPDRAGGCANNRDTFLQNPQVTNFSSDMIFFCFKTEFCYFNYDFTMVFLILPWCFLFYHGVSNFTTCFLLILLISTI